MKKALRTFLVILSVVCMLLLMGLAGGSDAGSITAGQALVYGALALAGCIGCAWGAERIEGRE